MPSSPRQRQHLPAGAWREVRENSKSPEGDAASELLKLYQCCPHSIDEGLYS
jgi:hypothetical protein